MDCRLFGFVELIRAFDTHTHTFLHTHALEIERGARVALDVKWLRRPAALPPSLK